MENLFQVWDDELARVAQKWADQCANVDYKGDYKRKDPKLFHDPHPQRKVGEKAHNSYKFENSFNTLFTNLMIFNKKPDCNIHILPADFSDWRGVGQNVARDIAPGTKGEFNATKLVF